MRTIVLSQRQQSPHTTFSDQMYTSKQKSDVTIWRTTLITSSAEAVQVLLNHQQLGLLPLISDNITAVVF